MRMKTVHWFRGRGEIPSLKMSFVLSFWNKTSRKGRSISDVRYRCRQSSRLVVGRGGPGYENVLKSIYRLARCACSANVGCPWCGCEPTSWNWSSICCATPRQTCPGISWQPLPPCRREREFCAGSWCHRACAVQESRWRASWRTEWWAGAPCGVGC